MSPNVVPLPNSSIHSTKFVVRLLQKLFLTNQNVVVSPFAVLSSLAVVIPASSGKTRAELLKTLFDQDESSADLADRCVKEFAHSLALNMDKNECTLSIANFAYIKQEIPLSPEYLATVKKHFKVQVKKVDFMEKSESEQRIMNEIKKATKGQLLDAQIDIEPHDAIILVSAIHFKDEWAAKFLVSNTKLDGTFQTDDGLLVKNVLMMHQESMKEYYFDSDTNTKAVHLQYSGRTGSLSGNISMVIIMPVNPVPIKDYLHSLTHTQLDNVLDNLNNSTQVFLKLQMPRFSIQAHHSLKSTLEELGLATSFNLEKADLRNMSIEEFELCLSHVNQSAVIKVNEEGTEAGSYCLDHVNDSGASEIEKVNFVADRPFIYVLVANSEPKQILFIGVVAKLP